ncbi:substrate-binding domain-containing protein [Streptomyces sp. NPDC003036]|uniref:substrate-binding domain-containing protein n=1 Tax=Streptomyces sp. NPDC003036 TaxID=3154442 RepID=UPI0033A7754B
MVERAAERPTLGLVTANIHLGVGATLWSGVLAAAERNDANLVCLPGGPLRPGGSPRNALYALIDELIDTARLDGLICWTSTLGLPAGGEEAARFADRLAGLPVVSLNQGLAGHETLLLDSHAGMREAVGHLVETHGHRRIACIRGPLTHPVSLDRYRAYTHAMARHRIPVDRSLVAAAADFGGGSGGSALRVLLDVRGLRPGRDFDAIVACSDVLAADALRSLTERGVRVPGDVAVTGFNDSPEARLSDPPLTSVALPFAELGALAVDTLMARLRSTRPPTRSVVPGTLVTRRSCGCHSPLVAQGVPAAPGAAAAGRGDPFAGVPVASGELAAAFHAEMRLDTAGVGFLSLLEDLIGAEVRTPDDASAWDSALLRARDLAVPALPPAVRARGERLFGQARLMVADKSRRLLEYERWAKEQEARRLRELGTALTTAVDTEALADALSRHLPDMGIPSCRLVLYGDEPGAALLPPPGPRFTVVAEPLHIGDEQLGHVLFDAGGGGAYAGGPGAARRGPLYRALGDQISAALQGIRLFDEVRRARDAAERANRLKTRLLDNATDELRTPVETILRHTGAGVRAGDGHGPAAAAAAAALRTAHADAARLLRLIDDLLDLSRSEIDALDLSRRLLDPRPLLTEACGAAAGDRRVRLRLPRRLPAICADGPRLGQILRNLLAAAAALGGTGGPLTLAARVRPPHLVVRITGPGLAVPDGDAERLFEPFASDAPGTRLSLAVARRLAVLHGGSVTVCRAPGRRGLRLELPLPTPADASGRPASGPPSAPDGGGTLLVAGAGPPPREVTEIARRLGLAARQLPADEDLDSLLARRPPSAIAWDVARARPPEWAPVQRLHDHPACRHVPFLLYGPVQGRDLAEALRGLRPSGPAEPVLVAGGHAADRDRLRRLLAGALPGRTVRTAADGTAATALVAEELPCLLVVDRELPDMDGFAVVERVYETAAGRPHPPVVPVLMLSGHGFTPDDVRRAEPYPALVLLGRDILTDDELTALLTTMTARTDPAALRSHAPVRHALAHIEQHYRRPLSRRQIAERAGVSENHLGRLFHRELGLTLWDYLTRLRVRRAKERLRQSDDSVQAVARAVGFHDRAYFSRVFRKVTGVAPHVYREAS